MIYHYTTFEGLKGILTSKKLWLTYSQELKDVTDRSYAYTSVMVNLFKSDNQDAKILLSCLTESDILDTIQELYDVPFYSASFCGRDDNEYLWKNYAADYNGLCLKIDDSYMKENIKQIIKENYNSLDLEDQYEDKYDLNVRKVLYELDESLLVEELNNTKKHLGFELSNIDSDKVTNAKFLLKLILMRFAGTIKHHSFENEEELRILFQNYCDDNYVDNNSYYLLKKARYKDAYDKLGLNKENTNNKRKMELNLEDFFDSKLIPEIIVGKNFNKDNIKEIEDLILANNLSQTKITY